MISKTIRDIYELTLKMDDKQAMAQLNKFVETLAKRIQTQMAQLQKHLSMIDVRGVGKDPNTMQYMSVQDTYLKTMKLISGAAGDTAKKTTETAKQTKKVAEHTKEASQASQTYGQRLGTALKSAFSLEMAFRRMSFVITAMFSYKAFYAILNVFKSIVSNAIEFETTMAKVATMLDKDMLPQLDKFADKILEVSKMSGRSFQDLGNALYDILSAKIPQDWAPLLMEEGAKLAVAGFTNVKTATKSLITMMKSYGGTVEDITHFSNLMTNAVVHGRITFEEYASQVGKLIPQAALLGISAEKITSAYAVVTQQLGNAKESATALRRFLLLLGKENEDLNDIAINYGVTLSDILDKEDGFTVAMKKLMNATREEKIAIAGSVRAFGAFASLVSNTEGTVAAYNDAMNDANKTQDKFNLVNATAKQNLDKLKASATEFSLTFDELVIPSVKQAVDLSKILIDVADFARRGFETSIKSFINLNNLMATGLYKAGNLFERAGEKIGTFVRKVVGIKEVAKKATEKIEEAGKSWARLLNPEDEIKKGLASLDKYYEELDKQNKEWARKFAEHNRIKYEPKEKATAAEFKKEFPILKELLKYNVDVYDEIEELWQRRINHLEEGVGIARASGKDVEKAERDLLLEEKMFAEWRDEIAQKDIDAKQKVLDYVNDIYLETMEKGLAKDLAIKKDEAEAEKDKAEEIILEGKKLSEATTKQKEELSKVLKAIETQLQRDLAEIRNKYAKKEKSAEITKLQKELKTLESSFRLLGNTTKELETFTTEYLDAVEKLKTAGAGESDIMNEHYSLIGLLINRYRELKDAGEMPEGYSFSDYLAGLKDKFVGNEGVIALIDTLIDKMEELSDVDIAKKQSDKLTRLRTELKKLELEYSLYGKTMGDLNEFAANYVKKLKELKDAGADENDILGEQSSFMRMLVTQFEELKEAGVISDDASLLGYLGKLNVKIKDEEITKFLDALIEKIESLKGVSEKLTFGNIAESFAKAFDIPVFETALDQVQYVVGEIANTWRALAATFYQLNEKMYQDRIDKLNAQKDAEVALFDSLGLDTTALQKKYADQQTKIEEDKAKAQAEAQKKQAKYDATINLAQGLIGIWSKQLSLFGLGGVASAGILSGLLLTLYGAQMAIIDAAEFASGGLIGGSEKVIRVNEQGQEYVVNAQATKAFYPMLEAMNNFNPVTVPSVAKKEPDYYPQTTIDNSELKTEMKSLKDAFKKIKFQIKLKERDVGEIVVAGDDYNKKVYVS